MATSRFVEVTDEEINYFNENAYFSNNYLCNYTKTIIHFCLDVFIHRYSPRLWRIIVNYDPYMTTQPEFFELMADSTIRWINS